MPIIPTPEQARELRALFAHNVIIDELEIELRQRNASDPESAARILQEMVDAHPLSPNHIDLAGREFAAIIARFVDEPIDELASCPDCECCSQHQCTSRACDVDGFGCPCTGGAQ